LTAAAPSARRDRIGKIGLELYTVRSEMGKDVAATLARVAKIGYREVEFAGYFNLPAGKVRELLEANGLTSPSSHTAIELQENDFDAQAKIAKTLGQEMLVVPSLNTRGVTDTGGWKAIAQRFNALGRRWHDVGLRFAFHNHAGEGAPMADGARPYDVLLGETDPQFVDFQMDLYWMVKSGGDPVAYFNAHPGRFRSVHVKDASAAPELAMRAVGQGTIDWKRIFAAHAKAGIRHYLVEHDNPGPDPFVSITASHDYLAQLSF
ncbi:MAG TPA: sugar phosphate isomerase/epimerase family protein, partial [Gemmatimonadaceae bacterium]|nr:sugar phosphate isomerase/epimerase family protein [Gemmatimonadaceae bacterium]